MLAFLVYPCNTLEAFASPMSMTYTTTEQDREELERLNEMGSITYGSEILASIPSAPLFIASQFVSKDRYPISFISVKVDKTYIGIYASNGHMAFRFKFPKVSEGFYAEKSFLIGADTFKKSNKKSYIATICENGYISFRDKKGHFLEARQWKGDPETEKFPNIEQIFPSSFSNNFENSFWFNAKYLGIISKAVSSYSSNFNSEMSFSGNSVNTPFLISSEIGIEGLNDIEGYTPTMEFLIMPVTKRY